MSDHFDPINNPQNFRDSYADIKKYADPCGQEAHDDIIKRLLCTQYDKVGKLLEGFEKTNNLGEEGVKLQTACSGTDAPALALTFFQEAAERHGISFKQSHEMSCEIEPFKQAYLQNNFDSIIYPDIGKLTDTEGGGPRDIFGILQPIPDGNFFVAGTVCKNFSSMRGSMRIDIEDKGQSGETFLAAVNFLEKVSEFEYEFNHSTIAKTNTTRFARRFAPSSAGNARVRTLRERPRRAVGEDGRVHHRQGPRVPLGALEEIRATRQDQRRCQGCRHDHQVRQGGQRLRR